MYDEKIAVRAAATGQALDVAVLTERREFTEIVVRERVHGARCKRSPTRTGTAYVGRDMGGEIVYERARNPVALDIDPRRS